MLRAIRRMESAEGWAIDDEPETQDNLLALAAGLRHRDDYAAILQQPLEVLMALGYIRSGRALRLLAALDEAVPGAIEQLTEIAYAEQRQPAIRVHLDRLETLDRLSLINQVFGKTARDELLQALEATRS